MEIRTIFEDNIYEYTDHVDEDVAENMGRMCYRGIAGHDPDDDDEIKKTSFESEFLDSYTVQRGESILAPILTF